MSKNSKQLDKNVSRNKETSQFQKDRVSVPSIPLVSAFEGRTEKEPKKLDTRSNVVSAKDLLTDCWQKYPS